MLITALLMTGLLGGAPSPEEPASDQDSVVATAPATSVALDAIARPVVPPVTGASQSADPHGLSTDQQIAQWLTARTPAQSPYDSPVWRDDRKMHGEFDVGFGTGGYESYGAAVSLPIGESGRLDLSIRKSENDPYRRRYGSDYDPFFADSGYVFPGHSTVGASIGYERRLTRPDGPPNRWTAMGLQPASEE